ncbi:PIN domain-containing protein [Tsukamurella sp. USMM236]|uniref:PIN domain-containing protein n=1 Tax=Tsukamurella sp. USMM236 TaxID=3081301 RepID=UPI00301AF63D
MTDDVAIAVDTSVAVALLFAEHDHHAAVAAWAKGKRLALSGRALAETYSVLTRLPGEHRLTPDDAARLIDDSFPEKFALPPAAGAEVHHRCVETNIAGGQVYDALVAFAALDNGAVLATRDGRARGTYNAIGVTTILIAS